jgi:hypothetical protein
MTQIFAECFVMHVNVGPVHTPCHEYGIYIRDVSKQVTVGVHQPTLGVVFFAFLIEVASSIDCDRLSLQIKAEITSDNDTCIV